MATLAQHFDEGGWGMYWVLGCSIAVMSVALRKVVELYHPRPESGAVLAAIERALRTGDLGAAVSAMLKTRGELAAVALAGLMRGIEPEERIDAALAGRFIDVTAPLHRGLPFLMRLGQIATLFGLLGAITGLTRGFGCVANADASSRATALAAGISESMNCTAFGLLVSTLAVGAWWMLVTRAHLLEADVAHGAQRVRNLLRTHRPKLRWHGERAAVERGSYRLAE